MVASGGRSASPVFRVTHLGNHYITTPLGATSDRLLSQTIWSEKRWFFMKALITFRIALKNFVRHSAILTLDFGFKIV